MLARRIVITGLYFVVGMIVCEYIGAFLGWIWWPLGFTEQVLAGFVGWNVTKVWRWTDVKINDSFYCASEMHLHCDNRMGCECQCHEEWDG